MRIPVPALFRASVPPLLFRQVFQVLRAFCRLLYPPPPFTGIYRATLGVPRLPTPDAQTPWHARNYDSRSGASQHVTT
jgi:hypothetical protein